MEIVGEERTSGSLMDADAGVFCAFNEYAGLTRSDDAGELNTFDNDVGLARFDDGTMFEIDEVGNGTRSARMSSSYQLRSGFDVKETPVENEK